VDPFLDFFPLPLAAREGRYDVDACGSFFFLYDEASGFFFFFFSAVWRVSRLADPNPDFKAALIRITPALLSLKGRTVLSAFLTKT